MSTTPAQVVLALGHQFPTYTAAPGLVLAKDGKGDYVHDLHVCALAERVVLARVALRQGRAGKAAEILDEAYLYLTKATHTR